MKAQSFAMSAASSGGPGSSPRAYEMKLPQFFRKLMYISIWVFVGMNVVPIVALAIVGIFHIEVADQVGSGLLIGVVVLWVISFITMMGSMIAAPLVRSAENATLRGLGASGTATILDFHTVTEGQGRYGPAVTAVRFKLRVRTPEGETFDAIAEDSAGEYYAASEAGSRLKVGQEVPVKYDPHTKEVALVMPRKKPKVKKPNW